ncbi:MAG: type 4a pilus biogenesis protein PilO [Microgenomates group bacterium]
MDKKNLLKIAFNQKTIDYTFAILFFLVFSVFIVLAIKPTLKTIFSLKKQEKDLANIDNLYDKKIINIVSIQSQIEENRENLKYIDQAIPLKADVNKLVDDVKKIADKDSFFISKANISDVNLRQTTKKIEKVSLNIEGKTKYENLLLFINDLFEQRRIKTIEKLIISKDNESSDSGQLNVSFIINGFYL